MARFIIYYAYNFREAIVVKETEKKITVKPILATPGFDPGTSGL